MTVKEAAERLEISVGLVYTLIQEERLGCLRIGTTGSKRPKIVIWEKHVAAFVESCEVKPSPVRGRYRPYAWGDELPRVGSRSK